MKLKKEFPETVFLCIAFKAIFGENSEGNFVDSNAINL